ncbi:CDP-alcohol phosphatidyltransferase family protein [Desulfosarcina sp.]|uniref:CDP-alcohol phosphatidyltransferase family protein n=1 Tax=Desulfosarcina sp. TaxID=2027861 RepID=UPI0029A79CE0|nr:CDP-alcohol phosphatidyltransferase family protein [Desulfosarcina sp.]MDX2454954.1 CDP-alcohol phosphatidyltransferase family protein [Desulfosarcina sp.]MDX2492532.1 CDP-alcohol phosphatidyltransferase family protein [Desulfosarcina sp.]
MTDKIPLPARLAAIFVYSRPVLIFGGMICALAVIWGRNPVVYTVGVSFLILSMIFDLVDGWFSARFRPNAPLAPLADRLMDKLVYSIIFPVIAAGMMWRLLVSETDPTQGQLMHAIFVLVLCVTVLVRDSFASFMRGFAIRQGVEPESSEYNRMRTIVAAPVSALLYAYAFYIPAGPESWIYFRISYLGNVPLRILFFVEILFFIINLGSIAGYCRKYGTACLDELCYGDEVLRRKILSVFPNALTVMNALMGLIAVFFAYQGRMREAYLMMIGAATFDKLDGALARRLGLTEPLPDERPKKKINMGSIMDDLADAISFCIVPAWIFYVTLNQFGQGRFAHLPVGWIALFYAAMGMGRLVYFTLDKTPIPGFFKGLPTPAAAMLVMSPLVIFDHALALSSQRILFWGLFATGTMVFAGVIMNLYPIRYIHLGRTMSRHPWFGRANLLLLTISMFTPIFGQICLGYGILYLLSPLFTWRILPKDAARESRRETLSEG